MRFSSMMKKKQKDFQKVKLRPGRPLPKGRNETKTSFQTRKVNVQQQIKETADEPTLEELLSFLKSTDAKIKFDNLRRLFKHIRNNKDNLPMYFHDVLKELGRTLQESDPKIRSEAILILGLCAEILTDNQWLSFIIPLTTYLNCMITHISFQVRQDALKFLDVMLKTHRSIICQSHEILFYLLNLISCKESGHNNDGRKLLDIITPKISTDEWRKDVLERILTFLSEVLKEDSTAKDTDDSKKIYWDSKSELYLPLYLNSGPTPAKFDYSLYSSKKPDTYDSEDFKRFVSELISLLSAIRKGFAMHRSFSEYNIKYLNIITQILCYLGEWAQKVDLENDLIIAKQLKTVSEELMKSFPFIQQARNISKGEVIDCLNLNLGLCYLYCICRFLIEKAVKYLDCWEKMKLYLVAAFQTGGAKLNEKSISLLLKISKIVIKSDTFDVSTRNAILVAFMAILKARKISPSANDIYQFFMDITLDDDLPDMEDCLPVQEWFNYLPSNLRCMMDIKRLVPNYLDYLKQLCARRIPLFMRVLNNISPKQFLAFLKSDDEDLQRTANQMFVSRPELSPDILQFFAEAIRDGCFALGPATRLIRCLHSRFLRENIPIDEEREFVKILLNLCCDTSLIYNPVLDENAVPLKDTIMNFQRSFLSRCEIYPTSNFEFHHEIFKVCAECLFPYLRSEFHVKGLIVFVRTVFDENSIYPMHSAVAFVELFKRYPILNSDEESADFLQSIIYSFLLYICFLTEDVPEEHWNELNFEAVENCLDFINVLDIIDCMDSAVHSFQAVQVYHILRTLRFLYSRRYFEGVQNDSVCLLLHKLNALEDIQDKPDYKSLIRTLYEYLTEV